ncbi:DUF4174 domain-containing protein [Bernardetia sp. MNP-M8]|uniref:DUF4174 domain-containing protein n=1 Tax=Bernardetia sp. MNP-M8 TaxID=3127470 RepID=UPI0030CC3B89
MKLPIYFIITLLFLLLSCKFMDNKTDLLANYKWKNRILVIFSDSKDNSLFQKQLQLFADNKEELKERDLIIFQVFKEEDTEKGITPHQKSISSFDIEQLKKRFDFSFGEDKNKFTVVLVGKDGETKLKTENEILTLEKLFGTIDAMPMRQSEMKKGKN